MKNLLLVVFLAGLFATGCKQKDTQAPMIFLNGDNPMTIKLNSWWRDPGATVDDNNDGTSLLNAITVTHNIDINGPANLEGATKTTGTYSVVYTVKDKAGNESSVTRTVIVVNSAAQYATKYETTINSNPAEEIVKDTFIISQDITFDTRTNYKAWFPKLGGRINNNPTSMVYTIRSFGYFIADSIVIPRQTYYIKELAVNQMDTVPFLYQIRGVAGNCHITDTIDPFFSIRYVIEKYRVDNSYGLWDTLGSKWIRFRSGDIVEAWVRF
jgi:hypothetical protein